MLEKNHRSKACSVRVQKPHFFLRFRFILSVSMRMPLFVSLCARFLISTHIQRRLRFRDVHVSHVALHARDEQKTATTSTHRAIHETDFRC